MAKCLTTRARGRHGNRQGPSSKPVKSACVGVPFDLLVEADSVEIFEPDTELGQLIRRQFG
jgi:hypothetical protein